MSQAGFSAEYVRFQTGRQKVRTIRWPAVKRRPELQERIFCAEGRCFVPGTCDPQVSDFLTVEEETPGRVYENSVARQLKK